MPASLPNAVRRQGRRTLKSGERVMRGLRGMLLGLMVSVGAVAGAKAQTVEIEYWQ